MCLVGHSASHKWDLYLCSYFWFFGPVSYLHRFRPLIFEELLIGTPSFHFDGVLYVRQFITSLLCSTRQARDSYASRDGPMFLMVSETDPCCYVPRARPIFICSARQIPMWHRCFLEASYGLEAYFSSRCWFHPPRLAHRLSWSSLLRPLVGSKQPLQVPRDGNPIFIAPLTLDPLSFPAIVLSS